MWFRTPSKPVDALITFLIVLVFQCFIFAVRISANIAVAKDPTLQGHHLFGYGVLFGFGFFAAFLFFVSGSVKFLMVKEEQKQQFSKIMRWNWELFLFWNFSGHC